MMAHATQTVTAPKPDFLSMVANAPPDRINGCKHCQRTVFWNGATWNHANDLRGCEDRRCIFEKTGNRTVGERDVWSHKWPHILGKVVRVSAQVDVYACRRCERGAYYFEGINERSGNFYYRFVMLGTEQKTYPCPAAVATPAATRQGIEIDSAQG